MGKGQDKIASSLMDLQPTAIVEFFLLYFNTIDKADSFIAFHGGSNFNKKIVWQGVPYLPVPVETEGFEINANGQMPRPKIRISNKDYFMTDLLIRNSDFQYSKVVRKRTFVKYLDDVNFDGGNPWGEADASAQISNESYIISQKTTENKNFVEFELTSPLDLDNFELNNRLILSRYCSWVYRGKGCNYDGPPVETEDGTTIKYQETTESPMQVWNPTRSYESGVGVYLENPKIYISKVRDDGSKYTEPVKIKFVCQKFHQSSDATRPDDNSQYWIKDGCSKKLSACKLRFNQKSYTLEKSGDVSFYTKYIDFSSKTLNPTNNIAYHFTGITASSEYFQTGDEELGTLGNLQRATYVGDDDFDSTWVAGTGGESGIIYFNNLPTGEINRINLYDLTGLTDNFNFANITISGIPTNYTGFFVASGGSMSSITNLSYTGVTGVKIAASGCTGSVGLTEVDLISNNISYGLYNTTFNSPDKVHQKQGFLIGMWGIFPSGVDPTIPFNLFHNIKDDNRYSGINLYLSGERVFCDFATTYIQDETGSDGKFLTGEGGVLIPGPVKIAEKSIDGDYQDIFDKKRFCLFLESYQNHPPGYIYSTTPPYGTLDSRIRIYDSLGNIIAQYYTDVAEVLSGYSGESFLFKDPIRQNGIGNLYFGINQWQQYERGITYTSPMYIGSTAIWTSESTEDDPRRSEFTSNRIITDDPTTAFPKSYSQVNKYSPAIKNLYAWWDMDIITPWWNISTEPPFIDKSLRKEDGDPNPDDYIVYNSSQNNTYTNASTITEYSRHILILTGLYYTGLEIEIPSEVPVYNYKEIGNPVIGLPFGGFPATDRYAR